jgi:hypothetical protein
MANGFAHFTPALGETVAHSAKSASHDEVIRSSIERLEVSYTLLRDHPVFSLHELNGDEGHRKQRSLIHRRVPIEHRRASSCPTELS